MFNIIVILREKIEGSYIMDVKKSFIIACLVLMIMMIVGGVSASEDIDSISSAGDLNETLEVNEIDEGDNLASDGSDSDGGNLKASDDNDVLGAGTITELNTAISSGTNDFYGDYISSVNNQLVTISSGNRVIDGHGGTWSSGSYTGRIMVVQNDVSNIDIFKGGNVNNVYGVYPTYNVALYKGGGAILFGNNDNNANAYSSTNKNITFTNCTFIDNRITATTNHYTVTGGAIYFRGNAEDITFCNCNFTNNYVDSLATTHDSNPSGGAIFFNHNATSINIINSTFYSNKGTGGSNSDRWPGLGRGGAICFYDAVSDLTVNNTSFNGNSIICKDGSSYSDADGGAIAFLAAASDLQFNNVNFTGNNIYIKNNNNRKGYGGAIYFENAGKNMTFRHCNFTNNSADGASNNEASYGTIYFGTSSLEDIHFEYSYFESNKAKNDYHTLGLQEITGDFTFLNTTFKNHNSKQAPLYFISTSNGVEIINSSFINNTVTEGDGGAIKFVGKTEKLIIEGTNFINNSAARYGGAIYFAPNANNITIKDSSFDNNFAQSGGAIEFYATTTGAFSDNVNVIRSNFTGNKANSTNVNLGGSAIEFIKVKNVDIQDSIFKSNVANYKGTILFNDFNDINLTGTKFLGNSAVKYGAAICYAGSTNGNSTLTECEFKDNKLTSAGNGAAVYLGVGNDMKFNKCNFTNNTIILKDDSDNTVGQGGAIYSVINNVAITENRFVNNYASRYGGAVNAITGTWNGLYGYKIDKSTFINNTAHNGGAVNFYHVRDINITDSTFNNNTATEASGEGGALSLDGFNTKVSGCNFTNNDAGKGSAISYIPGSTGSIGSTKGNITNCRFDNNTAITAGTIWFESSQGTINECYFTDNVAPTAAGVYVNIDKVFITNSLLQIMRPLIVMLVQSYSLLHVLIILLFNHVISQTTMLKVMVVQLKL